MSLVFYVRLTISLNLRPRKARTAGPAQDVRPEKHKYHLIARPETWLSRTSSTRRLRRVSATSRCRVQVLLEQAKWPGKLLFRHLDQLRWQPMCPITRARPIWRIQQPDSSQQGSKRPHGIQDQPGRRSDLQGLPAVPGRRLWHLCLASGDNGWPGLGEICPAQTPGIGQYVNPNYCLPVTVEEVPCPEEQFVGVVGEISVKSNIRSCWDCVPLQVGGRRRCCRRRLSVGLFLFLVLRVRLSYSTTFRKRNSSCPVCD